MSIAIPDMPQSLTYAVAAAIGLTVFTAIVVLGSSGDVIAALLVLVAAGVIQRLVGRSLATIVTAKDAAATIAVIFVACALIDLAIDYPYQAVLFLLSAAALGFAFLLLQQGTTPVELRLGGLLTVAAPSGLLHLRMLEELRAAGILTPEEFAAKRRLVEA